MSFDRPGKRLFALAAILAVSLTPLLAENGRNFAGTYYIHDVVDHGTVVKFELHAKIFNYSGDDVSGATISVPDRQRVSPPAEAADFSGAISGVSIPYRKSVEVDGTFTVPAREYQQIQRGAQPNVIVNYTNEQGKELHDAAQLRHELAPKGAAQ